MNIEIKLKEQWVNYNNIYVKGHLFYNNILYKNIELCKLFENKNTIEMIQEIFKNATGFFSIIIQKNKKTILISDRVRSIPMFYTNNKIRNYYIISDNPDNLIDLKTELNDLAIKELKINAYVIGKETIYKSIFQSKNSQILIFNSNGKVEEYQYYNFPSFQKKMLQNSNEIIEQLQKSYKVATDRLIKYLNGRQAVIPLSGGLDSRLILALLSERKYENILTFTYGKSEIQEVLISKKLANYHNVNWICVPYLKKEMNKLYSGKKYLQMSVKCGMGLSVPVIQDWYAIDFLKKNNYISNDSVIIPGHTVVSIVELLSKKIKFNNNLSSQEIINDIITSNFVYNKRLLNDDLYIRIGNIIANEYKIINKTYSAQDAFNIICNYSYNERQAKFIANSVRMYEFYNLDWYLPFWDLSVLNVWSVIPKEFSENRKIYYEYQKKTFPQMQERIKVFGHDNETKFIQKSSKIKNFIKRNFSVFYKTISAFRRRRNYYLNLDGYISNISFLVLIINKCYLYIEMWCDKYIKTIKKSLKCLKKMSNK